MNSKLGAVLLAVAVLAVLGVLGFFAFSGGGDENGSGGGDNAGRQSASRYVAWDQADFEENSDKQRWLYFHADWCPDCRALDADINANLADIPEDVIIYKVDYDDNQDLRQRYGVPRQTTIIVVDNGGEKIGEILATGPNRSLAKVVETLHLETEPESEAGETGEEDRGETDDEGDSSQSGGQTAPEPAGGGESRADPGGAEDGVDTGQSASRYVAWDQADFDNSPDKRRWLYFHADWCPSCRALNADINANLDGIPEDVVIYKVDYDANQDVRQRYGVTTQSTVVAVDAQGEVAGSFQALTTPDLASVIEALE